MIIDGHAYCFPPLGSPAGYPSLEEKMREFHREMSGHHQPVWRVRDRAPADNSTLVDPETKEFHDVEWTYGRYRFSWEYEGETYTKQYFPPMLHNLECSPELLITEMDYIGVDMAVLHTYPTLGRLNDYYAEAVASHPTRLMRLISVYDDRIPGDPGAAAREVEAQVAAGGKCGFQFITRYYYLGGRTEPWDDGAMRPFWRALAELGIPVYFTLSMGRSKGRDRREDYEGYLNEHRILQRWMDRYPDLTVVLTHGLPWGSFLEGDRIVLPEAIWKIFENPQCHLQLLFPIGLGGRWEYPWLEAEPTIRECVQRIGADRLIYGTDMPMVARYCTYRQTLDQFRKHCDFLSESERRSIIGGTAARVMGVDA